MKDKNKWGCRNWCNTNGIWKVLTTSENYLAVGIKTEEFIPWLNNSTPCHMPYKATFVESFKDIYWGLHDTTIPSKCFLSLSLKAVFHRYGLLLTLILRISKQWRPDPKHDGYNTGKTFFGSKSFIFVFLIPQSKVTYLLLVAKVVVYHLLLLKILLHVGSISNHELSERKIIVFHAK